MSRSGIGPQTFGIVERTADDFNNNLTLTECLQRFCSREEKYKSLLNSKIISDGREI